jgi:hypothetical protein
MTTPTEIEALPTATEAALCCMIISNPGGGERPHAWQKRVNDLIRAQRDALTALQAEREELALAICGGEDAPGYANAQTVETLVAVARSNGNAHMQTINQLLKLQADRDALRAEQDQAEQRGYANAMEAERKLHEDALETLAAERAAAVARAEAAEATIARLIAELAEARETLRMFKAWDFPGDLQDMAVQLEAEKARAPTLAEALAVPEVAKLVEALKAIAEQKKTDELETEYDAECVSFEDGFDMCIDVARAAIKRP